MIRPHIALLLLVAACSAEAPKPVQAQQKAKAKPAEDPNPYPVYRVAVDKGGLLLTDPKTSQAKPAAFGLRQSLILGILARTLGAAEEGHDKDCGYDFARWPNGLTLWFDAGDFAGWERVGDDPAIGVAPGTSGTSAGVRCRSSKTGKDNADFTQ